MSVRLHQLLDNVLSLPGLLQWRMRRFDADFRRGQYGGVCRGVYKTYQEAAQGAPSTLPLGYNHEAPTTMYRDRLTRVWPSDYAMMLWLIKIFQEGATRVFDLGGHVGVSYYAYQKYIDYPSELVWQLLDVPSVAVAGRQIALEHDGRRSLNFVDDFASASEADVLFTSGCLQYLEDTLAEKLALLPQQPQWVLVNLLPLHDSLEYWTVQNIGKAFCPYRIQRKATFFADMERLGYEIFDVWENAEKRCPVMFEPEHSLDVYFGAALRLKLPASN